MPTSRSPLISVDDFNAMKARVMALGDSLTDEQLLDLADCYHEMLRQRRAIPGSPSLTFPFLL